MFCEPSGLVEGLELRPKPYRLQAHLEGSILEDFQKHPEAFGDGESQGQLHYHLRSSLDLESSVPTPGFSRRSGVPLFGLELGFQIR
jgi:hypothetical protein